MRSASHALGAISLLALTLIPLSALADDPLEPPDPPASPASSSVPAAEQGPPLPPAPPEEAEAKRRRPLAHAEDWGPRRADDAPSRLPYREGKATPRGYEVDTVPRSGMVIGGAVMAGGLHLISMIAAVALDAEADEVISDEQGGKRNDPEFDNRYTPLFIPLVGPFVAVKTADANGTGMAILVMNGIAQVTGCSLVIAGLASPKKVLVRQDPVVGVVPLLSQEIAGVAIEGRF